MAESAGAAVQEEQPGGRTERAGSVFVRVEHTTDSRGAGAAADGRGAARINTGKLALVTCPNCNSNADGIQEHEWFETMKCPNCGSTQHEFLLIDCTPSGEERERVRYCFDCKKEAAHDLAGCLPRVLYAMNLPEDVLAAALVARRYVVDRRVSYPVEERLRDLMESA